MYRRLILAICIPLLSVSQAFSQTDDSLWARNFGTVGVSGDVKALQYWGDTVVVAGDIDGIRQTAAISPGFVLYDLIDGSWHLQIAEQMDLGDEVRALEVMPNGDLIVGGDFSFTADGFTLENIAVYRKDGTWSTLSGDTSDFCEGPVNALLEFDDKLYIGGEFQDIGFTQDGIAFLFAVWSEAAGFQGTSNEPIGFGGGPGTTPAVYALEQVPGSSGLPFDNDIYVGGSFLQYPGDTLGNLLKVETFDRAVFKVGGGGTNGPVYALKRPGESAESDDLYIGGDFTVAGGIAAQNCAMYDGTWHALGDGLNGPVHAITQYPAAVSPMHFAGDFNSSGTTAVGAVPGWNYDAESWEPSELTTEGPINALESINGNYFVVGGEFEFAGDSGQYFGVLLFDDGEPYPHEAISGLGDGLSGASLDVAADDNGNFYVIGGFTHAGGTPCNYVAKWDGRRWHPLGDGLASSGPMIAVQGDTVYAVRRLPPPAFNAHEVLRWDGASWSSISPEMPGTTIKGFELDTLGHLYLVGRNLDTIGLSGAQGIIKWDGSQWLEVGGPMTHTTYNPIVNDIYIDSLTNDVYVCGIFQTVDGVPASNVARWDGNFWHGMGNAVTGENAPNLIGRAPEGEIVIAGFLDDYDFRFNYQSTAWISYAGGRLSPGSWTDLLTVGCHLFATGGPLQYVGDVDDPMRVYNIARWDRLAWDGLGSGVVGGDVSGIAVHGDQLAVAGGFNRAGGKYARSFSIWNGVIEGSAATDLTLLTPAANDTLEYGDAYEITWDPGTTADLVAIEISLDSGQTWSILHNRAEAAYGSLYWSVPDTNAPFCKIRISDGDAPCTINEEAFFFSITSDPALDVAWLERKAGTYYYEPFIVGEHSWSWGNDSASAWPEEYWQAFDYDAMPWPLSKIEDRSRFPDWWTFEDGWGEDFVWKRKKTPRIVRGSAYALWNPLSKRGWEGSCYGFAVSALLAFRYYDVTSQIILNPERINDLELTDLWRRAVNKYWSYQFGPKHLIYGLQNFDITPMGTLRLLRDSSFESYQYPRALSMLSMQMPANISDLEEVLDQQVRGHTIVPYRIANMPDSLGIYRIYVYDNNFPDSTSLFVRVDSINETWSYIPPTDDTNLIFFDTCCGLYATLPIADFTVPPNYDRVATKSGLTSLPGDTIAMVLVSGREDILFTDSLGREFGVVEGVLHNDESLGFPMVPLDPHFSGPRPIGYVLPNIPQSVVLTQLNDSVEFVWHDSKGTFQYRRVDCDTSQTDNLIGRDSSWMVASSDPFAKPADLTFAYSSGDDEYYFQVQGIPVSMNDSLNFTPLDNGSFRIKSNGDGKLYDLILWRATEFGQEFAQVIDIGMGADVEQWIEPGWENLEQEGILVFSDFDGDGFPDNSVRYSADIITDVAEDEDRPELPDTYTLSQNYPNPFNPSTTIDFSLPVAGEITLEIINILGQSVHLLVDEDLAAGNYTVEWNGTDQSGKPVATGVYFYRLTAEGFSKSKKMLLLK